jgi:DNA-binding transcriptional regulator YhcF (GntR family)
MLLKHRREGFYAGRVLPVVREAKNLELSKNELQNMIERVFDDGD